MDAATLRPHDRRVAIRASSSPHSVRPNRERWLKSTGGRLFFRPSWVAADFGTTHSRYGSAAIFLETTR